MSWACKENEENEVSLFIFFLLKLCTLKHTVLSYAKCRRFHQRDSSVDFKKYQDRMGWELTRWPPKGAHHLAWTLGPTSPQGSLPWQVQSAEPASGFQAGGRHCRARRPGTPHCGKTGHSNILIFPAGGIRQGGFLNPSQWRFSLGV